MKKISFLIFLFVTSSFIGQQNLNFKIEGLNDTTIFLARYFGDKLYYDTSFSKNQKVVFNKKTSWRDLCSSLSRF